MDEKSMMGKHFEFDNDFFFAPRSCGPVNLFQAGELCCERGFEIDSHLQICNEISYILSGKGYFIVNGEECPVAAGDLFINQKGEFHAIRSSNDENLRYFYIGFEFNEKIRKSGLDVIGDFFAKPIPVRIRHNSLSIMGHLFDLLNEIYAQPVFYEEMLKDYLMQILIITYRIFNNIACKQVSPDRRENVVGSTVYSVIHYIDTHVMDIESVSDISRNLGYSYVYLSHLFRNKIGMTLQNYINYKKIEKSLELIETQKLSITQVAMMLHFGTVQSFSKAFKRTLGFPPTQYRKKSSQI